jgi:DNA processing protein
MGIATGSDRRDWLALVGSALDKRSIYQLLQAVPRPAELFALPDEELTRRFGLTAAGGKALRRVPASRQLDEQERAMDRHGIALLPVHSPEFPRNLFQSRIPPPAIFLKGRLEDVDSLAVALVGPRNPTPYGKSVARRLATDFAPNLTVVSGAAMGVDSTVHQAALDHGGRTLAVLGCGIDVNYPAANQRLRERIGSGEAGALISVYPPGTPPLRGHFPARNFILAALSMAVIVVEASARSGALVTARAAGEEGRPVYAVPGDITRMNSEGSNALLRDGAIACTSAADVISDLEPSLAGELEVLWQRRRARAPISTPSDAAGENAAPAAGSPEEAILQLIAHAPLSHDELIDRLVSDRLSLGDLATALLMLELDGRIEQQPGRLYTIRL